MTDIEHTHQSPALSPVAAGLRLAADCLATSRFCPSEADEAREYAAVAMAELSPDLVAQVERALRCGNHRRLDELANALEPPGAPTPEPKTRRPQLELNGEDLACLGMRRDSDSDFFAEIRREGQAELMRALGADCFKPTADPSPAKPRRQRKPRNAEHPAERGSVAQAAGILGLKNRKVQAMSQRGEIPGAAKMGRQWTYDLAELRRFVAQQEKTCASGKPRPDVTGGGIPFGARLKFAGTASDGRLVRMIQRSQRRVAKLAKSEQ